MVYDGTAEHVPFVVYYVCGGTVLGNYTTAFALARAPVLSTSSEARLRSVVEGQLGMHWSDWCSVDNSCFRTFLKVQ